MSKEKSKIVLIVRGSRWGVQLDVREFPIICPSCNNYFLDLYQHKDSRYGQVGSIKCDCGETVHLTDSDNIVEYIKCHSTGKSVTVDFKEMFRLQAEDFDILKDNLNYDIYEHHLNETLHLADLIKGIEDRNGIRVKPHESQIPLPNDVKKWIGVLKRKHNKF